MSQNDTPVINDRSNNVDPMTEHGGTGGGGGQSNTGHYHMYVEWVMIVLLLDQLLD